MEKKRLVFIYNETSNPLSLIWGFAHRAVSPSTYECNLCDLTYGTFLMKAQWKDYLKSLPFECVFYLKDKALNKYPELNATPFPAVFLENIQGELVSLVTKDDFDNVKNVESLIDLLNSALKEGGL